MALFFSLFLLFSILGIFYEGYFYVYHGFGIIIGNDTLNRAIKVSKMQSYICMHRNLTIT